MMAFFKLHGWACLSGSACVTSFVVASLPYVQWAAAAIAVVAGAKALLSKK